MPPAYARRCSSVQGGPRWTSRYADERLHFANRHPKARCRAGDFLAPPALMDLNTKFARRFAQRALVNHAVGGALELVRLTNQCYGVRQFGKRRLANRQSDQAICGRKIGDRLAQGTRSALRHASPNAPDQCVRGVHAQFERFVVLCHRRQPCHDRGHATPLDNGRHLARPRHAHEVSPTCVFDRTDDAWHGGHVRRLRLLSPPVE